MHVIFFEIINLSLWIKLNKDNKQSITINYLSSIFHIYIIFIKNNFFVVIISKLYVGFNINNEEITKCVTGGVVPHSKLFYWMQVIPDRTLLHYDLPSYICIYRSYSRIKKKLN